MWQEIDFDSVVDYLKDDSIKGEQQQWPLDNATNGTLYQLCSGRRLLNVSTFFLSTDSKSVTVNPDSPKWYQWITVKKG